MAEYVAHTFFGMRVMEELPPKLRAAALGDPQVFKLGLYGPDPLIFSLWTKWISDVLHKNWKVRTMPTIEKLVQSGDPTLRSFAAGYYLHQTLDDVIHPNIYRWMEEGCSHFRMEVGLDVIISKETGQARYPHLMVQGKERAAKAAALLIPPASGWQYLSGLWRMSVLCKYLYRTDLDAPKRLLDEEKQKALQMRSFLEDGVEPAAENLAVLLEKPGSSGLLH